MLAFVVSGLAVVVTVLLMLARTNMKRWLGYANVVDISFTLALFALFHGTFSGVVSASFAGIFMSLLLQVLRMWLGCEKIRLVHVKHLQYQLRWVYFPPAQLSFYGIRTKRHATA